MYWRYAGAAAAGASKERVPSAWKIEVGRLCLFRGPLGIGVPGVRAGLEGGYLPRRLFALAVQVVTEEGGFDVLPELEGGFVPAEGDGANAVSDWRCPSAVEPGAGDHEVGVLRIVLLRVTEDLPGTPGIFLIPEAGDIQVGHGGTVELVDPGFFFPELVVVRMAHHVVPVGQRSVEIFVIEIGEGAQLSSTSRRCRRCRNRSWCSCFCPLAPSPRIQRCSSRVARRNDDRRRSSIDRRARLAR